MLIMPGRLLSPRKAGVGGGGASSLLTGIVSWWDLPGGDATQTDDEGSNDLTANFTPGQAVGGAPDGQNCADLTALNEENYSISHASQSGLVPTGSFTMSIWVYGDTFAADMYAMVKYETSGSAQYRLWYDHGQTRFEWQVFGTTDNSLIAPLSTPSSATWYNMIVWFDSGNNEIGSAVNDGTPVTAAHTEVIDSAVTPTFSIGSRPAGSGADFWNGRVAMAGFWSKVLSSDERTELYNSGSGLRYPF